MTAPAADLEIRITTEHRNGAMYLLYVLHSPEGKVNYTHHKIAAGDPIRRCPEDYQTRLLRTIEKLNRGLGSDDSFRFAEEVERELEALGYELYNELFPKELKSAYREFRDRIRSLLIVSDEPWIPWELVKPNDPDRYEEPTDDFLCCQFELTRWLAGETAPSAGLGAVELGAARVATIEAGKLPGREPLPHAEAERGLLPDLAQRHSGVESVTLSDATFDQVEALLRGGGYGLLHFVGHGEFEPAEPNESRFLLTDGRSLQPRDLLGAIQQRIRQDRPLVFFNSCQVAQQGYHLTRLGGWAKAWVVDGLCAAFIGPQWTVGDDSAHLFAKSFYDALEGGATIAQAALAARLKVREEAPGRATWLAYTVYAHPHGRLRLGLGPNPLRIPESRWRRESSPPGALLRAEYGIVPFHGREKELDDLAGWCEDGRSVGVRLYTGAGGIGKTRLALELCQRWREQDWEVGFLAPDPSRSPADAWRDLVARGKPSLVVVDYAETRRDLLVPLLREIRTTETATVRLMLLARAALDWWEQLKAEGEGVGELLSGPATVRYTLMPLALSTEERGESYRLAAAAFAERLEKPPPEDLPDDLAEPLYERVLLLHMRALASIEGVEVQGEDGILDYVLHRERRFWGRLARERQLPNTLADGIGRAMAAMTLGGGVDGESNAVAAIGRLQLFADQKTDVLVAVARLLHDSYPGDRWIDPILPDLLGEHLIMREMEKGSDELLDLVLGTAGDGG
ncbi:MAG: CHAT domain-containing protein [bacterium]|nr:CHAT domain-containing protein [bacterium]